MMVSSSRQLVMRCALAVAVLAILVSVHFWIHLKQIHAQKTTAAVLNETGRLRFWAQKVSFDCKSLVMATTKEQKLLFRQALQHTLTELGRDHKALVEGDLERGLPHPLPPSIHELYFSSPNNLNGFLQDLMRSASALVEAPDEALSPTHPRYREVTDTLNQGRLLSRIEAVVQEREQLAEASNSRYQKMSTWLLVATLIGLILTARLVFWPAIQQIRRSLEHLEREVEIRTASLTAQNEELSTVNQERANYHRLFNVSLDLLCIAGFDGYFKLINPSFSRALGYSMPDILALPFLSLVHPDDQDSTEEEIAKLAGGATTFSFENRYLCKNGEWLWLLWTAVPFPEENVIFAAARDITLRKQSEESLCALNEELARSNKDLEDFAHVASHDLKAPLRGLRNLSQWLREDLGDSVPETSRRMIQQLNEQVARMEKLLNGLLEYARIGQKTGKEEEVSLPGMVHDIIELLNSPPEMQFIIDRTMPSVETDPVPLAQVLRNLVDNAIKHHDRSDGIVSVTAQEKGEWVELLVKDNGPGIPPPYHDKVFGIFQTLGKNDEPESTGLGLALVKRIVEGQGGEISLESEPGSGATFRFTWPRSSSQSGEALSSSV